MKTIGTRGSKDIGSDTARSGDGEALTWISGIRGNRDTGTRTRKAGIGMATTATNIARDPTAGSGPEATDSTSALTALPKRSTRITASLLLRSYYRPL